MSVISELEAQIEALRAENRALARTRDAQQLLLRAIADYAPIVLYAKDRAGRFTLSNRLHAELLGRPTSEVLGASEAELLGPETAAEIQAVFDAVVASGVPHVAELALDLPSGRRVFLEHVFPLHGREQIDGIGGVAIDISERKQAEDAVRIFVALAQHSPDGILVRPADPLAPMHTNPTLRRLLGLPADATAEAVAHSLGPAPEGSLELDRSDGESLSLAISHFEIPGADGSRTATATIVRDVTHLRRALEEREHQREINQRQQAELIAELSAPLLPLAPGVLVLPLIGSLDDDRSAHVREVVLAGVVTHRARVLILDLTGLRAVDGPSADRILGLVAAVQLVGARVVLTGIRPTIAATLIDVGFTSRPGLSVLRTLEDAVRTTLTTTRAPPQTRPTQPPSGPFDPPRKPFP